MHLWLYTLFIDHTYIFRSPSATILRVYGIKKSSRIPQIEAYNSDDISGSMKSQSKVQEEKQDSLYV